MQIKILFLMSILTIPALAQIPYQETFKNNGELKILSWNIYMLPYLSLFNNNSTRAESIADELENSDYQILVFQEAFSSKCRNVLSKRLKKAYPYQYGPANRNYFPFKTNSGLWVVSKIPLQQLGQIQFSLCQGFDAIARKGAVLFQGNFHGANFQLLTTHLQAENSNEVRSKQCQEIKEHLLNPFYSRNIPQLICGDFNIEMEDSHNYNKMLLSLDAKNGELSGEVKVTYDEINNRLARKAGGKSMTIDYVLVRNTERIHTIERRVQTFFRKLGKIETNLSDHYAMEFNVVFAGNMEENALQMAY